MAEATGYEIVEFFEKGWPDGYYSDESDYEVSDAGKIVKSGDYSKDPELLPLQDKYDLESFGCIIPEQGEGEGREFAYFFNNWKKSKSTVTLVVEVPKEQEAAACALFLNAGYKLKK